MTIFVEVSENKFVRERHPPVKSDNMINTLLSEISSKRCEIGCKVLLFTNRNWHMGFQLVPKSVTMNHHERHNECKKRS